MSQDLRFNFKGRSYTLPKCQAVFDTLDNADEKQQQIIAILQASAISGMLTTTQQDFLTAATNFESLINALTPQIRQLDQSDPSQAEIDAFVTYADNLLLPAAEKIVALVNAVLKEAGQ